MPLEAGVIYKKAMRVGEQCTTRDTLRIVRQLGIFVHDVEDVMELLGMYTYRYREGHILFNADMDTEIKR